jgi:hypothetical protein
LQNPAELKPISVGLAVEKPSHGDELLEDELMVPPLQHKQQKVKDNKKK